MGVGCIVHRKAERGRKRSDARRSHRGDLAEHEARHDEKDDGQAAAPAYWGVMANNEDPHPYLSPLAAGLALLAPAALAVATGRVLLFASLGPTAVMQAHEPRHKSSRFYAVVVSHLVGFCAGSATVLLLGLAHAPSVFEVQDVSLARAAAAVISIVLATLVELALEAAHPPAGSTTLLVALGSMKPTVAWFALLTGGVLAVATAGEVVRRMRNALERPRD